MNEYIQKRKCAKIVARQNCDPPKTEQTHQNNSSVKANDLSGYSRPFPGLRSLRVK